MKKLLAGVIVTLVLYFGLALTEGDDPTRGNANAVPVASAVGGAVAH
jgi:hypothetical protein